MKIGTIEANEGEKTYGFFKTGETHGRFPVHIPLHLVVGAADGPMLVVQAGASGLEIEPSLILPHVVNELDPAQIKGTLVLVPLMNTSGFEFAQVNSVWDDKHLNRLGRGNANGSVSEQLVSQYYQDVIAKADALVDIRTGSQWSYHHSPALMTRAMSMLQKRWQLRWDYHTLCWAKTKTTRWRWKPRAMGQRWR